MAVKKNSKTQPPECLSWNVGHSENTQKASFTEKQFHQPIVLGTSGNKLIAARKNASAEITRHLKYVNRYDFMKQFIFGGRNFPGLLGQCYVKQEKKQKNILYCMYNIEEKNRFVKQKKSGNLRWDTNKLNYYF